MSTSTPAYDQLEKTFTRLHNLHHLQSIVSWDQAACMPVKGNEARGAAMSELASIAHQLLTAPEIQACLEAAQQESLSDEQQANWREMHRAWQQSNALPDHLVQALTMATNQCEHEWRTQRAANDWSFFAPNLQKVVDLQREAASRLSEQSGLSPYDALLDQYEAGMTSAQLDVIFGELRQWLPGLIQEVERRQSAGPSLIVPNGTFPITAQRELCEWVMRQLGFDFDAGRLDVSTHPFCGGVPEDVRITTRFKEEDFLQSLMGTIHETGHARYEQGRPKHWITQPLSQARSMAIHESQSLSFEMQLARSQPFITWLAPHIRRTFGHQAALDDNNLFRLVTHVKRGFIRVDADEVTYPAHVIIRYEIEKALMAGAIQVNDIPELWDQGMYQWLGLRTQGNHQDGAMQDVHWPSGAFGYFPCYTLGAMYAAQWFAKINAETPNADLLIQTGQFDFIMQWLDQHIWHQGSRWTTSELVKRASGEPLNTNYFQQHLRQRYLS